MDVPFTPNIAESVQNLSPFQGEGESGKNERERGKRCWVSRRKEDPLQWARSLTHRKKKKTHNKKEGKRKERGEVVTVPCDTTEGEDLFISLKRKGSQRT